MRVSTGQVSAVIPTRGDVDLTAIRAILPFDDIVVYDNSVRHDLKVYARYAALKECRNAVVYTQDDDCLVPHGAIDELLEHYEPGRIVANMPRSRWNDYPDSCLVGWGSVFDAHLPVFAFTRWATYHSTTDQRFLQDCDVVFSTLTPHLKLDAGFTHLPWAEGPGRMFTGDPDHKRRRDETLALARKVRDASTNLIDFRSERDRRAPVKIVPSSPAVSTCSGIIHVFDSLDEPCHCGEHTWGDADVGIHEPD